MGRSTQRAAAPEAGPDRERLVLRESPIDHWESSQPVLGAHYFVVATAALAQKAQRARIREQPRTSRRSAGSRRYASSYFAQKPTAILYSSPNANWDTGKINRRTPQHL